MLGSQGCRLCPSHSPKYLHINKSMSWLSIHGSTSTLNKALISKRKLTGSYPWCKGAWLLIALVCKRNSLLIWLACFCIALAFVCGYSCTVANPRLFLPFALLAISPSDPPSLFTYPLVASINVACSTLHISRTQQLHICTLLHMPHYMLMSGPHGTSHYTSHMHGSHCTAEYSHIGHCTWHIALHTHGSHCTAAHCTRMARTAHCTLHTHGSHCTAAHCTRMAHTAHFPWHGSRCTVHMHGSHCTLHIAHA